MMILDIDDHGLRWIDQGSYFSKTERIVRQMF